mmetsp:Transcript_33786/g.74399  ORF Transcript_33786/g.74399 Transcript_33786/m.74399 type:complete len:217 (+) Transcript_33786:1246-1896(+)
MLHRGARHKRPSAQRHHQLQHPQQRHCGTRQFCARQPGGERSQVGSAYRRVLAGAGASRGLHHHLCVAGYPPLRRACGHSRGDTAGGGGHRTWTSRRDAAPRSCQQIIDPAPRLGGWGSFSTAGRRRAVHLLRQAHHAPGASSKRSPSARAPGQAHHRDRGHAHCAPAARELRVQAVLAIILCHVSRGARGLRPGPLRAPLHAPRSERSAAGGGQA